MVKKLKKLGKVDILSVGPNKEEEKKDGKKEEKTEEKKEEKMNIRCYIEILEKIAISLLYFMAILLLISIAFIFIWLSLCSLRDD